MKDEKLKQSKIIIVGNSLSSVLCFRLNLITALQDRGLEVHLAIPDFNSNKDAVRLFGRMKVRVHEIPLSRTGGNPVHEIKLLLALRSIMRTVRPEVVLGYTIKPAIYASIAAKIAGVPRIYALITGLGYSFIDSGDIKRKVLKKIVSMMYFVSMKCVTKVIFQNHDDEELFRARGILPTNKPSLVVNGSGVDIDEFAISPLPGNVSFLLIARLLGDKGVREYVSSARVVKEKYPESTFRLVGEIDENPDSISKTELNNWVKEGTITYLGQLGDVRPAISKSSVFVLPSYREGIPRTVLEAMSMGRPIITTDAPGCRETVQDGQNGFLVPVKSVSELASCMLKFLDDPSIIEAMGEHSRRIAERKYDVHKVNTVMCNALEL